MKGKIKILLVDDHPLVREGVRASLVVQSGMKVVGEAADGAEAIKKAESLKPDIILMDISMPKVGGIEATKRLLKRNSETKVLILSMHQDDEYIREIVRAGAKGYMLKDAPPQELIAAIIAIHSGRTYFSDVVSEKLLANLVEKKGKIAKARVAGLTEREEQVLVMIADGLSSKEIGERLNVGRRTIESHREHIMLKLNIRTIAGLTKYALSKGLVSL